MRIIKDEIKEINVSMMTIMMTIMMTTMMTIIIMTKLLNYGILDS